MWWSYAAIAGTYELAELTAVAYADYTFQCDIKAPTLI